MYENKYFSLKKEMAMKNKHFNILLIIGMSIFTNTTYSNVFLQNNYGSQLILTIKYYALEIKKAAHEDNKYTVQKQSKYIEDKSITNLGKVEAILELSIKTTGIISSYVSSSTLDLMPELNKIKAEQAIHPHQNAIISISWKRTFTGTDWDVTHDWQETQTMQSAERRLDEIQRGIPFGPIYARKARDICSADYTMVERAGKINLCTRLKHILTAPEYTTNTKEGFLSPNLAPTKEEIMQHIDRLSETLEKYKQSGEVPK